MKAAARRVNLSRLRLRMASILAPHGTKLVGANIALLRRAMPSADAFTIDTRQSTDLYALQFRALYYSAILTPLFVISVEEDTLGDFVKDQLVPGLVCQLNLRFAPGDGIREMAALQKQFKIFHRKNSLRDSFALLNSGPIENWAQRRGWYEYLDDLKTRPSDVRSQNGHNRIISALAKHLASREPVPAPVCFKFHASSENPGVVVIQPDVPYVFSTTSFLTISMPTTPVERDRAKRRAQRK